MSELDETSEPLPTDVTRDVAVGLYRAMALTRALEERLILLKRQGRIAGGVYRSLGQEACSVASAAALDPRRGDLIFPLIRDLGAVIVLGATPLEIFRQNLSKATSPTVGREQSFHFADLQRGFIGHVAVLGDMVPVAAGCALSFRMRNEARVALVYSGDGGTSTGAFHEGVNFAAVQRCPLVIVIENNGYAYSTPTVRQSRLTRLSDKAAAYGIPGETIDGNDAIAVLQATRRAVARARSGEGPTILELATYRRLGHAEHDDQRYVPAGEAEAWAARDPLAVLARRLASGRGTLGPELARIDAEHEARLTTDLAQAESEPDADPRSAVAGVYGPAANS